MPVHEAESCREAFWTIYSMEQNGTLSFGRPSSYHEDDIDQDLFAPSEDPAVRGWDLMNIEWIEFGTIQGRIYRKLYSVKGLARSVEKRQKIIDDLAKQLDIWYQRFVTVSGGFLAATLLNSVQKHHCHSSLALQPYLQQRTDYFF
jgi:hypothetical protein